MKFDDSLTQMATAQLWLRISKIEATLLTTELHCGVDCPHDWNDSFSSFS
jgi:hypothetical protein